MDIQTLTTFFMWCTIISGGILVLWSVFFMAAPNFVYRTQSRWFSLSRENFDLIFYCFLAMAKLLFIFFALVPWIALSIIG